MKKSQEAIITMLNDDKTVPSKVKIEDVKIFNNLKKSHALQVVINHCKEMDQGLVHSKVFIDARNAIECSVCQRDVKTKENLNASGLCTFCQKQIDREKKEKEVEAKLYKNWKQLEKDLIKLSSGYVLLKNNKIKRTVSLEDGKDFVEFSIFREAVYGGSAWHQHVTGYALRIRSNHYGLESLRLKKDFSSKNVAKSLHSKIEKMVEEHENRLQLDKKKKAKKTELIRMIIKELGVSNIVIKDSYTYPQGRQRAGVTSTTDKKVQLGKVEVLVARSIDNPDRLNYRIRGISKSLTLKQIKEISKIAK